MGIINYYNISHAEVFVFDDFLIKQVKEGVKIDLEETEELKLILEEHFKNKKMAYISNRVTSYSVNPLVYKEVEKIFEKFINLSKKIWKSKNYNGYKCICSY